MTEVEKLLETISNLSKENKHQSKRLEQLEDEIFKWKNITNSLPNSIYVKNTKGEYVWINEDSAQKLRGVHGINFDIIGKKDTEVFPVDVAKRYMANDRLVMESRQGSSHEETSTLPNGKVLTRISFKEPRQSGQELVNFAEI